MYLRLNISSSKSSDSCQAPDPDGLRRTYEVGAFVCSQLLCPRKLFPRRHHGRMVFWGERIAALSFLDQSEDAQQIPACCSAEGNQPGSPRLVRTLLNSFKRAALVIVRWGSSGVSFTQGVG